MRPTDDTGGFLIRQLIWAADRDSDLLRPFFRLFGKDPKSRQTRDGDYWLGQYRPIVGEDDINDGPSGKLT